MTKPAPERPSVLRQIDTPHGRIAATTISGEGPPIVLLHGFPDDQHIYTRLLSALAPRAAIAFDFVGYGRSGRPADQGDSESDSQAHLKQISAVLDGVGAERAILVGHDASGPDAVRFALAEPDRVERVVLLNTTFGRRKSLIMPEMTRLLAEPELASLADDMLADQQQRLWLLTRWGVQWELDSDPDGIRATSIAPQFYGTSEHPDALKAIRHWTSDWLESLAVQEALVEQGALGRLEVPVSVIFGANDHYLGPDLAAELAGLFRAASLHLVKDAGHYPQHDQPERVAAIINKELSDGPHGEVRPADPDLEVVLAAYRAFALGDIDAAVANMAADVVWIEPDEFPDGGRHDGRDAVAGYLRRSRDSWETLRSVPIARRVGDTIAVRHFLEGIDADGTERKAEVADIFTVRNGLIIHMQAYADPDRAFRD